MHRAPYRGNASDQNELRRWMQQIDVDVKRLWKRLGQTPQEGLGDDQWANPISVGSGSSSNFVYGKAAAFTLAGSSVTVNVWTGTVGSETSSGETITAYVRRGLVQADQKVLCVPLNDGTGYEVMNPALTVRGKVASDLAPGSSATLTVWSGTFGSETQPSGSPTVSSVRNDSSCVIKSAKMATAQWVEDNSSWQFAIGKTS